MNMTPEEILRDFKEAKNQKAQIAILADQNLCTKGEIIDILKEKGVPDGELGISKTERPKKTTVNTKKAAVPKTGENLKEEEPKKQQYKENVPSIIRKAAAKEMLAVQEEIDRLGEDLKTLSEFLEATKAV